MWNGDCREWKQRLKNELQDVYDRSDIVQILKLSRLRCVIHKDKGGENLYLGSWWAAI